MLNEGVRSGWPRYDIEKKGENEYGITMAVAGFSPDEIELTQNGTQLLVSGQRKADQAGRQFLHQGIVPCLQADVQSRGARSGRGGHAGERAALRQHRARGCGTPEAAKDRDRVDGIHARPGQRAPADRGRARAQGRLTNLCLR
ncbi:Hsp20 family protein [Micromonospora sp. STR1s_5]|nr:Hsp20 family protein [Micromonospora sp. STR1s_5]